MHAYSRDSPAVFLLTCHVTCVISGVIIYWKNPGGQV